MPGDGVGGRAAGDLARRAHAAVELDRAGGVDQLHDALLDAVRGEEAVLDVARSRRPARCRCRRPGRPWSQVLLLEGAEVADQAGAAVRLAGDADVAAVQDQPVVGVELVGRRAPGPRGRARPRRRRGRGAMPVRLATRKTWVSTAIAGSLNQVLSTTLAVLRPTPGRLWSAAREAGTSPPKSSARMRRELHHVPGLVVEEADGLDVLDQPRLAEVEHLLGRVGDAGRAPRSPGSRPGRSPAPRGRRRRAGCRRWCGRARPGARARRRGSGGRSRRSSRSRAARAWLRSWHAAREAPQGRIQQDSGGARPRQRLVPRQRMQGGLSCLRPKPTTTR